MSLTFDLVIRPRRGWQPVDFRELWLHRELLGFLIWRDIKIRYRQTLLGGLWAILQPLLGMVVFSLLFNRMAGIPSDSAPYPLFVFAGLIGWTFFANGVTLSSNSLIGNQQLVSKIYFPRIFIPLGSIGALLLDLFLNLGLMVCLMVYYRWSFSLTLLWLPVFVLLMLLAASGIGFIFSAFNVRFRDVKYAVPFFIQMGLFATPVIYPSRLVPQKYQLLMGLNPMTGVVSGFRYALLGTALRWDVVLLSTTVSLVLFLAGLYTFRRMEWHFADII